MTATKIEGFAVADALFDGWRDVVNERVHGDGCSIMDVINAAGLALTTALAQIDDADLRIEIRDGTLASIIYATNPPKN
jgi:hypothetical protein